MLINLQLVWDQSAFLPAIGTVHIVQIDLVIVEELVESLGPVHSDSIELLRHQNINLVVVLFAGLFLKLLSVNRFLIENISFCASNFYAVTD